ncbi:ABC transporter ATP-binding protein [Clostridioides difficile]|nr:ABC transporter ATP-binding protein [Clostridioides difficile]MDE3611407.1 ABC transporter ATP-binding protein [Clostridioides difficile]MDM9793058.1 ABC transporter ATP-binding protein [Clostridioides difficile]
MEIKIEHLNKNYGKQCALKDISLHIPVGMYGLLGENGAGKTTLMRILATLLEQSTGTVEINGIDIKRKKEIRKIIGYLPQEFSVYPNMTVYSALDYLGILAELPKDIRKSRINELLKQVNLEQEKNKRFKNLSGGMKRRFGIAQALLSNPQILIIDEPTAGLDPEERLRFYNLLSELAMERIILLSTHIASDIEATCSKVAVLSAGTVIFEGNIENLLQLGVGKVYTTTIMQNELYQFKKKYRVISIHQNGINVSCRFLANTSPEKDWVSCQPTIEDSYMYLLSSFKQGVE